MPFTGHGVLFVPDDWVEILTKEMHAARLRHHYWGEMKFALVKGGTLNDRVFQVAREWIVLYFGRAVGGCPFKAFITEDGPNRTFPYPGDDGWPEHWSKSLLSAFISGIRWSFYRQDMLRVRPIFDDTSNPVELTAALSLPDQLQAECNTRRGLGRVGYPRVRVARTEFVPSDPKKASSEQWLGSELAQLCDLFLGAIYDALQLRPEARRGSGRVLLAKPVCQAIGEAVKVPWLQQLPLHRRFSVSFYPDEHNLAYPAALRMQRTVVPLGEEPTRLPGFE